MLQLEQAVEKILTALPPPVSESVPLQFAAGRVLLERVVSALDLPPFDNSAMDGYAVRAADVANANSSAPVSLRLAGRVAAGDSFSDELVSGECVRLFTGSPLPRGADAVVMQEDTRVESGRAGEVLICDRVCVGENVRCRGEDVRQGADLLVAGEVLTAARISLLAATGLREVNVGRRPRVGLLATGSELREAGTPLSPGQIYESNRAALAPLIARAGGLPESHSLVPDNLAATQGALERALAECDIVVTSGGVSVGEMDFVKAAFENLGGSLEFWKVAIRPGRPFVFGRRGTRFLLGLPGNPVSAFVTCLLLVQPALWRWQGARAVTLPSHPAVLGEPLSNAGNRRHFLRVRVDETGRVFSAGQQASHALASLAAANGLLSLPPGAALSVGAPVMVLRWE